MQGARRYLITLHAAYTRNITFQVISPFLACSPRIHPNENEQHGCSVVCIIDEAMHLAALKVCRYDLCPLPVIRWMVSFGAVFGV